MTIENWYFKDLVLLNLKQKIDDCRKALETETSSNAIAGIQGKLEGFRQVKEKIESTFGPMVGTMNSENAPEISNLSKSVLEHFSVDISNHQEEWKKIELFTTEQEEKEKDSLWNNGRIGRDLHVAHGTRDGLRIWESIMNDITSNLKHAQENPTLFDEVEEEEEENLLSFPEQEFDTLDNSDSEPSENEEDEQEEEENETDIADDETEIVEDETENPDDETEKPYLCNNCGKGFDCEELAVDEERNIYLCPNCGSDDLIETNDDTMERNGL